MAQADVKFVTHDEMNAILEQVMASMQALSDRVDVVFAILMRLDENDAKRTNDASATPTSVGDASTESLA